MSEEKNNRLKPAGSLPPWIIVLTVFGVAIFIFIASRRPPAPRPAEEKQNGVAVKPAEKTTAEGFVGARLAGNTAPLLDFNQGDYELALKSDKTIVLYFYANWCPICREEIPELYGAFHELAADQVIGFRVNFNDSETDAAERNLARQFGVAYQHTKVFLKNGQRLLKSPETWRKDRYLSEINKALAR